MSASRSLNAWIEQKYIHAFNTNFSVTVKTSCYIHDLYIPLQWLLSIRGQFRGIARILGKGWSEVVYGRKARVYQSRNKKFEPEATPLIMTTLSMWYDLLFAKIDANLATKEN